MNKKSLSAGLLILSVGAAEVAEAGEQILIAQPGRTMASAVSGSLAFPPHTHLEAYNDPLSTTSNAIYASGAQVSRDSFRLHIVPVAY